MTSYDVLSRLNAEGMEFDLGNGRVFRPGKSGDGWLQYYPDYLCDAFSGAMHYEVSMHYSGLRLALHDERGARDDLWWKLREIAEQHCLFKIRWQSQILLERVVPRFESGDSEADFSRARSELLARFQEMDAVLGPFLSKVIPVWTKDAEKGQAFVQGFNASDGVLTASDCMRRFVQELPSLDLGKGKVMKAHPQLGCFEGPEGWKIFESFLDESGVQFGVHFEVLVSGNLLSVELHDERDVANDKLSRVLTRKAEQNGFVSYPWGVQNPRKVECLRDFDSILKDVCFRMGELWNVYGDLLMRVSERGVDSIGKTVMKSMAPIPSARHDSSARCRKDIPEDTLCWVTTIGDLVNKEIVALSGPPGQLMIAGNYVIPSYQRKYTWTAQNVSLLCRDLLRAANDNCKSYHLGTIIFHSAKDKNESNEFFVVDGQQRLRTISRLLSREIFSEGKNLATEKQFTDQDEAMIWNTLQSFGTEDCSKILDMLYASTLVCIAVNDISESFQLFSTQNGRGKPLSPENLLKAFHFHEMEKSLSSESLPKESDVEKKLSLEKKLDVEWENENRELAGRGGVDGKLLHQVLGEHLYRIRCWLRGRFPEVPFSAKNIKAFKGLTIDNNSDVHVRVPLQNLSLLRRKGDVQDPDLAPRDGMDPYGFIDQPIVNGEDFFSYVKTYIRAYKNLFGGEKERIGALSPFYGFYEEFCLNYPRAGRRGDTYARHVFQSLCLFCYDRFGSYGLNECMRELYCFAYYERAVNSRCYYQSCGREFTVRAIQHMSECSTVADVKDRLSELYFEVINSFDAEDEPSAIGLECVRSVFAREEF